MRLPGPVPGGDPSNVNLLGQFFNGLFLAVQGIFTGFGGILDQMAGFFNGQWGRIDDHQQQIQDLQDQTQVLEGVVGYGQWTTAAQVVYPNATDTIQPVKVQMGPVVGCTLISPGVIQLNSKGLWDIEGHETVGGFTGSIGSNGFTYSIQVSNDNFATIWNQSTANFIPWVNSFSTVAVGGTFSVRARVVVPTPGYRVRLMINSKPPRGSGWGARYSSVNVLKLSDELGPGMRLRNPFVITGTDWVKVGTMVATGGGTVTDDGAVVATGVTNARVDSVATGSGLFDVQMRRSNGTYTQSLSKSSHALNYSGMVAAGDRFELWVRDQSGSGTVTLNAVNGTWLTVLDLALLASGAPTE